MRDLHDLARRHHRWFVLTGAGISTDSGIPAYRDQDGAWCHPAPITLQEYRRSNLARRRYWARSMVGWPRIAHALPNAAHSALAALEAAGRVALLVTQNVDGLHRHAGSRAVIELHGNLDRVICLDCAAVRPRAAIQRVLEHDNP